MAAKDVKKHLPLLKYLEKGKPGIVRAIIKESDPTLLRVICCCAHNAIKGNVPLNKKQYRKLSRFKKELRLVANKKTSARKKKQALQKGGFLSALLGAVVPALTGLIGQLLSKT